MEGVKVFYEDLKNYMKILRIVFESSSVNPLEKLTRKELELYHQLPKDIFKVGPILVASALPFSLYLILPLVYYYPRQLLTSHFWTLQQKSEFKVVLLKNRLLHNKPVFRHLQLQLNNLEDHPLREDWACILGQLGSGVQPSVEQILTCKPLFMKLPYRLNYLSGNHTVCIITRIFVDITSLIILSLQKHLRKMHNSWYFFKRRNLRDTAIILMAMDKAIMREGGVHNMPVDSLKHACYIRGNHIIILLCNYCYFDVIYVIFSGLNPTHVKNEDLVDWLNQWIKISQKIDKDSYSLLLHCPILLGYNQPSNWSLIYPYKD